MSRGSRVGLAFLLVLVSPFAHADDLDLGELSQDAFNLLAEDLAALTTYKGVQPAEPYGVIGYDISTGASAVRLGHRQAWRLAGSNESTVSLARVSVTKGLPAGFDAGGYLAVSPGQGQRIFGAQLRYAIHEGGVTTPAVGLRASINKADGFEQVDVTTQGLDLSISKRFGSLTPYAGAGRIWSDIEPDQATGLRGESISMSRGFAGLRISAIVLQLTLEVERVGDTQAYAANLGFMF